MSSSRRTRHRWGTRSLAILGGVVAAVVMGVQGAVVVLADCGDVGAATVGGSWTVRVTFDGYTGPGSPAFARTPGSTRVLTLTFEPGCSSTTGACGLQIAPAQPGQGAYFDNASGLEGSDPDHPLVKAGLATYTSTFRPGGYGGRNLPPCPAPPLLRTLSFTVRQAVAAGGGWNATVLTGSESIVDNWACNGNVGYVSSIENYSMLAVPAGAAFPRSSTLSCGAALDLPAVITPGAVMPSSFSAALPTPQQSFSSVPGTIVNAVVAVVLVLFITFPAQLFNKTFEENYDEIRDMVSRRFRWIARERRRLERESTGETRLAVFAAVLLGGALLGSLNDPGFGFNGSSVLTYAGVVASLLAGLYAGTMVTTRYRKARKLETKGRLHALPAGLLVAAACMLLSRSTHFQPGYLYGVIFGVTFAGELSASVAGLGVVLSTATTLSLAVVSWIVWLPVHDRTAGGGNIGLVLAADILAPLVVGGFVGGVITLLPLSFMPGGKLFGWSRRVWGATFALTLFALLQVLLRPGQSPAHSGNAPMVTAIVLFVCFGALSVGFHLFFERRKQRRVAPAATGQA